MGERKEYGSVEFYTQLFDDIIGDCQYDNPQYGDNMVLGFKQSLENWRDYYAKQVTEMDRVIKNFDA